MLDVGDKEKGSPEESESVLQLWIRLIDDQQHYRSDGTTPPHAHGLDAWVAVP
jgi:hypothetical protein